MRDDLGPCLDRGSFTILLILIKISKLSLSQQGHLKSFVEYQVMTIPRSCLQGSPLDDLLNFDDGSCVSCVGIGVACRLCVRSAEVDFQHLCDQHVAVNMHPGKGLGTASCAMLKDGE